jgi:hypothetical protein
MTEHPGLIAVERHHERPLVRFFYNRVVMALRKHAGVI